MSLNAVIVDDERLARRRLRELLSAHPEIVIVAEAEDAAGAVGVVERWRPDVLFLDIELASDSGIDLPEKLTHAPVVVFVTAYDTFAVRAFAVRAFDYLLKPVHPARLAQTVRLLLEQLPSGRGHPPLGAFPEKSVAMSERVPLKDGGMLRIVEVSRIAAILAVGAYTRVLLRDLPPMLVLRGISDWERILPAEFFKRIDRSLMVQLTLVQEFKTVSRDEGWLTLHGVAERLAIGRSAVQRLRQA